MAKQKSKRQANHKKQAWGIFLIGIALLLFLAIISYDVNDPVNLNVENMPIRINNWLGPLGATIAYSLMQWTLGYPIVVLPLLILLYGLSAIQLRPASNPVRTTFILIAWAFVFSIFLAFPEAMRTSGHVTEYYPSGLIGGWLAEKFVIYLGKIGGLILLIMASLILFVATIQIELVHIFRFFGSGYRRILLLLKNNWRTLLEKSEERKIARVMQKEERQTEYTDSLKDTPEESKPWLTKDAPIIKRRDPEIKLDDEVTEEETGKNEELITEEGEPVQSSLDELLNKKSSTMTKDPFQSESEGEVDFEVEEEHTDVEVDYDAQVKESIAKYKFPSIDILNDPPEQSQSVTREELKSNAEYLEAKLLDFKVEAKVIRVTAGPVITLYELEPARGVKVNSIKNLENDLALALEARGIRIIAPIPGKAAVGIEIPNRHPQTVYLKSLIRSEQFTTSNFELPLALGKTINGESYIADLTKMPHLLVAGSTGSGKSVGINTMIMSLLYSVNPGKVKFMMIDPKKLELSLYREVRDHYLLWRPDLDEDVITKPNNAVSMLNSLVLEMERRYDQLSSINARNIVDYNEKIGNGGVRVKNSKVQQLPYLIVIVDELADLMMVAAKEVETPIARLAQMARAVGIHLILATQRPSVDVITGMIKANFPSRIAYQVATKVDSRTVIDLNGAETLLGNGDLLYLPAGSAKPIRLQSPFISTTEIERVIDHIRRQAKLPYYSLPQPKSSRSGGGTFGGDEGRDNLYEEARAVVVQHQKGSVSLLQRRLNIGYSRAARLMDELEEDGVVGPPDGSKAREVRMTLEELGQLK
jgi:S-DNA-T family DNA segregation ATPase FtsK/SpoIIIE